jgi:hypothetical protein
VLNSPAKVEYTHGLFLRWLNIARNLTVKFCVIKLRGRGPSRAAKIQQSHASVPVFLPRSDWGMTGMSFPFPAQNRYRMYRRGRRPSRAAKIQQSHASVPVFLPRSDWEMTGMSFPNPAQKKKSRHYAGLHYLITTGTSPFSTRNNLMV